MKLCGDRHQWRWLHVWFGNAGGNILMAVCGGLSPTYLFVIISDPELYDRLKNFDWSGIDEALCHHYPRNGVPEFLMCRSQVFVIQTEFASINRCNWTSTISLRYQPSFNHIKYLKPRFDPLICARSNIKNLLAEFMSFKFRPGFLYLTQLKNAGQLSLCDDDNLEAAR